MASKDYRKISAAALERRAHALPKDLPINKDNLPKDVTRFPSKSGILGEKEVEIIESSAGQIVEKIKNQTWSSVEVLEAFCKSASIAQELTNCLTEIMFVEGRKRAKELDDHLASTGKVVGPLHGLPISLKDCFQTPPHPSSIGIAYYGEGSTTEQSLIVSILLDLGAVPYVKTNVPVAMMMMETDNNVWGPALNPHHRGTSPGGSSGGESALIAMHGAPMGVGTDIGGSIRIPSAFCGLYGIRPSFGRYPTLGTRSGIPGQEYVLSVNGPMARSLEDIILYSAAVLSNSPAASPWTKDPKCVPIPWRSEPQIQPAGRKLRFAFISGHDGIVTVHPPVERALNVTKDALRAAGHEILEWSTKDVRPMLELMLKAFGGFGGGAIVPLLDATGEPMFTSMKSYRDIDTSKITPDVLRDMCIRRNGYAKAHLDQWFATAKPDKTPIDGLIAPVTPWAAVRQGFTYAGPHNQYVGFSAWVNLLDLPGCTFPVTKADKGLDAKRDAFKGLTEIDDIIQADYDPEFYDGAPVGLQLIGERLQEEKVLELVKVVRDALVAQDGIPR